ncbi:hypothetical protein OG792_20730 [Micromonospora sp. NBC_01699]|uniref:hypothetical protein n=1 Tax=Micromonospora sp. NBC_01699 TaxID=2975984 RepID=UPI002E2A4F87|nr:hypothetical protein [Micromonospora sp. NBC_01699]
MIEELIRRVAAEDDDAVDELSAIADTEPQRLTPYQGLLLDLDLLWPPKLYRAADADVIRRVIEQVDGGRTPDRLNHLLLVLAHTGHPLAERAMRRWAERPPTGADELHVGPLGYAPEGGWTVGSDGNRRDLCGDIAYRWLMRETSRIDDAPDCPWCASPLWTATDIDTSESAVAAALAHTGWSGRLMIETCHFCACYTTLYSRVTPDGTATWWTGNIRPSYLPDAAEPEKPPALLPVLGPARPSPYQASAWERGGSTLGGRPDWIQDADHVGCPGCGQPMDYVGLIGGVDLDEFGEGAYYLHLHQPCGLAAVNYQQS